KAPPSEAETHAALNDAADAFLAEDKNGAIGRSLKALAEADAAKRASVETALLGGLKLRLDEIRSSLDPKPVTLATLPEDLRQDWVSKDGRARVEVRPKGNQNDNETMRRFAAAVLELAPNATGTPILIQESAKTVVHAFLQAGALALIL